jgi:hypothetical protein
MAGCIEQSLGSVPELEGSNFAGREGVQLPIGEQYCVPHDSSDLREEWIFRIALSRCSRAWRTASLASKHGEEKSHNPRLAEKIFCSCVSSLARDLVILFWSYRFVACILFYLDFLSVNELFAFAVDYVDDVGTDSHVASVLQMDLRVLDCLGF